MKVSEIFRSIQGEGKLAGTPSVFVRTSLCNLRCVWCDTPYTSWEPEWVDLSVAEIVETVERIGSEQDPPPAHVVVTGGEPFLQARELSSLCDRLSAFGFHITVETNATIFRPVRANLISMSPKLRNSTPPQRSDEGLTRIARRHEERRLRPDVIRCFLLHYANPPDLDCQVKFVVEREEDLEELAGLRARFGIPKEKVLLMAQATDPGRLATRSRWLEGVCARTGYGLSPRLHIELFGNRRGT
jgi:7-carboxy-7-deazaguanine synthase